MNKISIASLSFSLDEGAYAALSDYMDILHNAYDRNPDGKEIIADIEARIAELILNEQACSKVVTKTLMDAIIAQLGMPENYSGDDYAAGLSDKKQNRRFRDVCIARKTVRNSAAYSAE
ncbi:MAG: hypothetical protein L6V35_09255 [Alistipes putredinis]|nr:MAG: hypothetical protein L6V35_09255 [Alistipes putredinis]